MTREREIEEELIENLKGLKYTYRDDIRDREALERNFREKFNTLNSVNLTDVEFEHLLAEIVTSDIFKNAERLRNWNTFEREDGTPLQYQLVNLKDWCKNSFEVINQLRINTKSSHHRYDVILLVNGLPLVQIELKAHNVSPRTAMQQIVNYRNDAGNGYKTSLLCFMQLFIVSNRSQTWYFSNNNNEHFSFNVDERFLPVYRWAKPDNKKVVNLVQFAELFLAKCTLAEIISRYMVLIQNERKLMMMRPYQVYAVKAIDDCIQSHRGNGYIWHTTGSGKTLTSFKASTLLKDNPGIEKCLFVVDRKDLDKQTREEFNRFQPNCVEENTNTESLVRRLLSDDYQNKVIVTTIQKLGLALDNSNKRRYSARLEVLREKRIVFIFDECHRSQFGENHKSIREFFPKAQLFGFTGTPIFEQNAIHQRVEDRKASLVTTEDIFEKQLHAYTITDAIEDDNVLRFRIDYFKSEGNPAAQGEAVVKQAAVKVIIDKHNAVTADRKFNALFATAKIDDAIEYHHLFQKVQAEEAVKNKDYVPLNLAVVFSPPAEGNVDVKQLQEDLPQELEDNKEEPNRKKEALTEIIADYNVRYGTNHSIANFDTYYQDVQQRIKDQKYPNSDLPQAKKIDITIVVDMLLTGFDSHYLNTLYVDKNLKHHGLIQSFSRTNRVLNDTKPWGNILDFRAQNAAADEAIALFSGEKSDRAREVWLVEPAPKLIEKLETASQKLTDFMQSQGVESRPEEVINLKGDGARIGFIERFKEVRRLATQLNQYTNLDDKNKAKIEAVMPIDELRAWSAQYLEVAKRLQEKRRKSDNSDDSLQQLDFEFVLFDTALIDYDYIMGLIVRYAGAPPKRQKMTREQLLGLLASSARLMDEREELEAYIATLKEGEGLNEADIREGYDRFKAELQAEELNDIAEKHELSVEALQDFTDHILSRYIFDTNALTNLFRPQGLGWKARSHAELALMEDLIPLLHRKADGREISGLGVFGDG